MRNVAWIFFFFISYQLSAQDQLVPISYNPLQSGKFIPYSTEKASRVQDHLIFQFDTAKLPFKDDFSADHFPDLFRDTTDTAVKKIQVFRLLRNGNPIGINEEFSSTETYRITVKRPDTNYAPIALNSETITYIDYSVYPFKEIDTTVWPAYTIFDTINGTSDTVPLANPDLRQQTEYKYLMPKDSTNLWIDKYVYRNNDFPIDPPSIGVVTFDALTEYGVPYDFTPDVVGNADKMTSVPIDLSLLPFNDTTTYLSFYYQPQGVSFDKPDQEDSLVVDFFNSSTRTWHKVWGIAGGMLSHPFEQVFIRVDTSFHTEGFQFRFRNRAKLSGDFDQWHVDYIILDKGRNSNDTVKKDVAYIHSPPSLIKNYHSMPWFHYNLNPALFNKDTISICKKNRFSQSLTVFYTMDVRNSRDNFRYFEYPDNVDRAVIINGFSERCINDYAIELAPSNFSSELRPTDFVQKEELIARYEIDFRPSPNEAPDFFPSNDTVAKKQIFDNYYAYDDGTAEAGYGIQTTPGHIMLSHFSIPITDTLTGLQLYFLPVTHDITHQKFEIVVYNNLDPNELIYKSPMEFEPSYTSDNGFVTYFFDSAVVVNPSFYVGITTLGKYSMNIGYDFNTPNKNKIFIKTDQPNFTNPSAGVPEGSLMMRPVFRKLNFGVGVKKYNAAINSIKVYPNPSKGRLFIENVPTGTELKVFDTKGKLILQDVDVRELDISNHPTGMYFLHWISKDGNSLHSEKIITSP